MKKRKISKRYIIIAVVCLAIISVCCMPAGNSGDGGSGYSFTVSRSGEAIKTFSLAEIKEMDQVTVKKKIESGSKKDEEGIYTGVSLAALLNAADPLLLSECATFTTSAADGFSSVLSAEDLSIEDNVLVVYEKDGKALVPFSEGGTGPLRILIQSDEFGNRCTEYLIGVDCK